MFGLAFLGFVVLMVIAWALVPRAAFMVVLVILVSQLGWVKFDGENTTDTIARILVLIFGILGIILDFVEHKKVLS